jgi:hypothetical protein
MFMPFLRSYKRREIERPGSLVISMLLVVTHYLWSIFDASGLFVSSVLSSAVPLFSFHMLAGNLDPARVQALRDLVRSLIMSMSQAITVGARNRANPFVRCVPGKCRQSSHEAGWLWAMWTATAPFSLAVGIGSPPPSWANISPPSRGCALHRARSHCSPHPTCCRMPGRGRHPSPLSLVPGSHLRSPSSPGEPPSW